MKNRIFYYGLLAVLLLLTSHFFLEGIKFELFKTVWFLSIAVLAAYFTLKARELFEGPPQTIWTFLSLGMIMLAIHNVMVGINRLNIIDMPLIATTIFWTISMFSLATGLIFQSKKIEISAKEKILFFAVVIALWFTSILIDSNYRLFLTTLILVESITFETVIIMLNLFADALVLGSSAFIFLSFGGFFREVWKLISAGAFISAISNTLYYYQVLVFDLGLEPVIYTLWGMAFVFVALGAKDLLILEKESSRY